MCGGMALKTTRWDAADYLETREDIEAYLDAILDDGDPELLKAALGDIARAARRGSRFRLC
jgi:probable addiction module antidote protein